MIIEQHDIEQALNCYGIEPGDIERITIGLINATWRITSATGDVYALQRVNPLFPPEVNDDIADVTAHLRSKGMACPRIHPARNGNFSVSVNGRVFRLLSWLDGRIHSSVVDTATAAAAGAVLARFHLALRDFPREFRRTRAGVHDLARHLRTLREALTEHRNHGRYGVIKPFAERILDAASRLPQHQYGPRFIVHGDPKINNVVFSVAGNDAIAMIDLDTVGPGMLFDELGDAVRSWCNPTGEDDPDAVFDYPLFKAVIAGYREVATGVEELTESAALAAGVRISVELSARFCADALNECYFGWDSARFGSASMHNEIRARSQFNLAAAMEQRLHDAR
ncbi:MAG: phosphotransferase [Gammaproteobacteria bacterium]|nr:phosphotransferase [Gammaproteobacteria bacterium]